MINAFFDIVGTFTLIEWIALLILLGTLVFGTVGEDRWGWRFVLLGGALAVTIFIGVCISRNAARNQYIRDGFGFYFLDKDWNRRFMVCQEKCDDVERMRKVMEVISDIERRKK